MGIFDGITLGGKKGEETQAASGTFAGRIKALADQVGIKVQGISDEGVGAVFAMKDGRTQAVVFTEVGTLAGKLFVEISSPVADLSKQPLSGDAAIGLLRAAARFKVGGFVIYRDKLVVKQGMILSELTAEEFRDVTAAVAVTADDAEKALTGRDAF